MQINHLRIFLFFLFIAFHFTGIGQQNFWTKTDFSLARSESMKRYILPENFLSYSLDYNQFTYWIESQLRQRNPNFEIELPLANGTLELFDVKETPVFEVNTKFEYAKLHSFTGTDKNRKGITLKMSLSPLGVQVMITYLDKTQIFIDPYDLNSNKDYLVYYKRDYHNQKKEFKCGISDSDGDLEFSPDKLTLNNGHRLAGDCMLRTYRLALACTGEYAQFYGGTMANVLAAFNATITRVNGIYEQELGITFKLISTTDLLIFLDPNSDPYTNGNGDLMLTQNQSTIDSRIGNANYDIGHVFSTGGGGIAQLRSTCGSQKAKGVTGNKNPFGDPFNVDYVCHEIGHQFGANHTQNNNCQRNNNSSVEPGSGSTIMGYAGVCDPNIQNNSDPYFNFASLFEIASFVTTGAANTCAEKTLTDNNKPIVTTISSDFTIPVSTSFLLNADGSDSDGDILTYCWEQADNQVSSMPPEAISKTGPLFRSLPPSLNSTRFFPDLENKFSKWEVLPAVARIMNFRCTARDNNLTAGCTNEVNVQVVTSDNAGPFTVIYPNLPSVSWLVGSKQTVIWDVAKTNLSPVNCQLVDIYLSVNGGLTYPHLLIMGAPNIGSAQIVTPFLVTGLARIMVVASDNIFYDVSNSNFKIYSTFAINPEVANADICGLNSFETFISLTNISERNLPITLKVEKSPEFITTSFAQNPINSTPYKTTFKIDGLKLLNAGTYEFLISASSGEEKLFTTITLFIGNVENTPVKLITPPNQSTTTINTNLKFSWDPIPGIKDYNLLVSDSPSFADLEFNLTTAENSVEINLKNGKVYYWKVKGNSPCVQNSFSQVFSFRLQTIISGTAVVLSNNILLLSKGQSGTIDMTKLNISADNPNNVLFTLLNKPKNGSLTISKREINVGDNFTLKNIYDSKLEYTHTELNCINDSFYISVIDDKDRWLPEIKFKVQIKVETLGAVSYDNQILKCFGDSNGQIQVEGYGGTGPYSYSFDNVQYQTEPIFSGLKAGIYSPYIKDSTGEFVQTNEVNIREPSALSLSLMMDNYNLKISAEGGTGQIQYSLDNIIFSNNNLIQDPGNGQYIVVIRDKNECIKSEPFLINIPKLSIVTKIEKDLLCSGDKAILKCIATGGIPPYLFSNDSLMFQSDGQFQLNAGTYTFYTKDTGGKVELSNTVTTFSPIPITTKIEQDRFLVTVIAKGGIGSLEYSLDGIDFTSQNKILFNDNGTYKIYIRDQNKCILSTIYSINILKDIDKTIRNVSCNNGQDGMIQLQAANGAFPYLYSLNNSTFSTINEWSDLSAGNYDFTVKDNNNDTLSGAIVITQPDSLKIDLSLHDNILIIKAHGGTPPYLYSIDDGIVFLDNNTFEDLPDNLYNIKVKDYNNCSVSERTIISSESDQQKDIPLTIFPTPANDIIFINSSWNGISTLTFRFFNTGGYLIHSIKMNDVRTNITPIDIGKFPDGLYILEINTGKNIFYKKVLKN